MRLRILVGLWLLALHASAQTAPPPSVPVPVPAQRYLDILTKRPQPGTVFERFYAAWLEQGTAERLGEFLTARTKQPATKASDHLLLAIFQAHRGNDSEALAAYETALKMEPGNAAAWIERSRLEARALDFSSALQSLTEASRAKPDAGQTLEIGKLRGRALLRLGQNEDALRTWRELAAAHPEDEDLAEEMIDLLAEEGQYEAALEAGQALENRSRDPLAKTLRQLRLADILLLAERRDDALQTLRDALAATGADTWIEGDVLGRIARVFRMGDDVSGLEKFLAALVTAHPHRATLGWQHVQLLGESGQNEGALAQARALLQSNPGRRDLQESFLGLLESFDLNKEAAVQAQALVQQNAGDKELLVRLATLQHRTGDDPAAQATLEKYLAVAGSRESDDLRVARLLETWEEPPANGKPGNPQSPAAKAYARLVERFPESIDAQEALAHYLYRSGQRDAALAIWSRLAKSAKLEDLLRIAQALQVHLENRKALDFTVAREPDFTREIRYYTLLVQLGIANKELERTVPWARARLRLAQDPEIIGIAIKDLLLVLRGAETDKLASAVLKELQGNATPSIQNRCLLAALLESGGNREDAKATLRAAPVADQAVALSQLAQMLQNEQDWEKAAETLQKVIELPGGRNSARVQRIIDAYRRAGKPEEALKWTAEWKKLSPGAVQPWLDESRLLVELSRPKDALAVLRNASRKFPDNLEAASSYATLCQENGQPEEAERTYLALYEKTADPAARLRLLGPLALAAQSHGALPRLIENFQHRQKQNRASAQPWLALGEIHRASGNDEERRRCLYEASRLRPKDLELLREIARSEEEVGLTAEALRTLDAAAKLDKTTKTREEIARLQIESGDAELGYRMLFELAGGSQMDARAIEKMADTIAEKGEWERVITFLEPLLLKHPQDYRLHYLNGVALEEAGRERESVGAFLAVTKITSELPGVSITRRLVPNLLQQSYAAVSSSRLTLPPGAEGWLTMPAVSQAAYFHRQNQGHRGYRGYGGYFGSQMPGSALGSSLPANGFVQQPSNVAESPLFALAHVLQIIAGWEAADRESTLRDLKLAGLNKADLLLEAAENSPQLAITPAMLAAHPQDEALHAVWLLQGQNGAAEELLPACENAFKLLHESYPELALRAASRAWPLAGDQATKWVQRIVELCAGMPKPGTEERQLLTSILRTQSGNYRQALPEGSVDLKLGAKQVQAITGILKRWLFEDDASHPYPIGDQISAFAMARDWASLVEIIQHRLDLLDTLQPTAPPSPKVRFSQPGYQPTWQPAPMPAPAPVMKVAWQFLNLSFVFSGQDAMHPSAEQQKWQAELRTGLKPFLEKTDDPRLKLILRLISGSQQAILDELAPRLNRANPAADDLIYAGWLHQQLFQPEKALAYFVKADALVPDATTRRQLDCAILFHTASLMQQADPEKIQPFLPEVRAILERLGQVAPTASEKEQIAAMMTMFGLKQEAEKLSQSLVQGRGRSSRPQHVAVITNPYSRSSSHGSRQDTRTVLDRLLQQGNTEAAKTEALRRLRSLVGQWLAQPGQSDAAYELRSLFEQLDKSKLRETCVGLLKEGASSGWKARLDYAALLDLQSQSKEAISGYEAVLAANPRAFAAHVRLAILLAPSDTKAALEHWLALPATPQPQHLQSLVSELTRRGDDSGNAGPLVLARLLTAWLKTLPPSRPLNPQIVPQFQTVLNSLQQGASSNSLSFPALWEPYNTPNRRSDRKWKINEDGTLELSPASQQARDERRNAHDELCRAMTQIPELALTGFAPLGGLAMFEGRNLKETEAIALDLLRQRSQPKMKRRFSTSGNPQQPYGDPFESTSVFATAERIAMPVPALFATYSAATRKDRGALDQVIFPAIQKAEGKTTADYCRAYAALLMSDENSFRHAAEAWMKCLHAGSFVYHGQSGAPDEIVRLWLARKIREPLDELLLDQTSTLLRENPGYVPQVLTTYAFALTQRNPEALRSFVRRVRDSQIGTKAEERRKNIATWRETQQQQRRGSGSGQNSRMQQAVSGYVQWLQNLLQDQRGLALLPVAMEDGLDQSSGWLRQIASNHSNSDQMRTAEEFLQTAEAVGFLGDAAHFRAYDLSESGQRSTWLGNLVRRWRERGDETQINATLEQLGKRQPATFGAHLVQALIVKNDRTPLQFDGKAVPFDAAQVARFQSRNTDTSSAFRCAALEVVLTRHASEIATLSTTAQNDLSSLLRQELPGFPQAGKLGAELARVLAPLLATENAELLRKVDGLLAAKTWQEIGQREYEFTQQFPALLRDVASLDLRKADAATRHVVELLHASPEQKKALAENNRETPVKRLHQVLLQVPQLLIVTIQLAETEALTNSRDWIYSLCSRLEESLRDPALVPTIFTGTPWVAEAATFRDWELEDINEPTLLARLINRIEGQRDLPPVLCDHLSKQPPTFGSELLLAFLHRGPDDNSGVRSFYGTKRPEDSALMSFIQRRSSDFAKLKPEAASNLFALLNARILELQTKAGQDVALQLALEPLIRANREHFEAEVSRWLQAPSLAEAGLTESEAIQQGARLLDRLAQADKPRAVALLDQISKLLAGEEARNSSGRRSSHETRVAQWLQSTVSVPELFGEIMHRAEASGAASDPKWLDNTLTNAGKLRNCRNQPNRVIAFLEGAGMLNPAATFNPRPLATDKQQRTLLEVMGAESNANRAYFEMARVNSELYPGLKEELTKRQPQTFGAGIALLMLTSRSVADVSAFAQAHAADISNASPEQKKILAALFHRKRWARIISPLAPALRIALAPYLEKQAAQWKTNSDLLLKAGNWPEIASLCRDGFRIRIELEGQELYRPGERSPPELDYLADQLVPMAALDPVQARQVLQHVGKVYEAQFGRISNPFRKPPLDVFLDTLCTSPRLSPTALRFASNQFVSLQFVIHDRRTATNSGHGQPIEQALIGRTFPPATLANAETLVSTLDELGLLADSTTFDPVPLPNFITHSLLGLTLWQMSQLDPTVRRKVAQLLADTKEAKFGHRLLAACLSDKGSPEEAQRLDLCAAEFGQVQPQAAGAILAVFESRFPELASAASASGELKRFAPLFQLRDREERDYLDGVLAGRHVAAGPFRGHKVVVQGELVRLMKANELDEALKLLVGLRKQLEAPNDADLVPHYDSQLTGFLKLAIQQANIEDSPALLACHLKAATTLPGVRVTSSLAQLDGLFSIWEQRGGRAAPRTVFAQFLQEVAPYGIEGTAGLWLPSLHCTLVRMGKLERRELADWAAQEDHPELRPVVRELRLALSLIDATELIFDNPTGARKLVSTSPAAAKAFAAAASQVSALLRNESIPAHVRLPLAAFSAATYPGLLDEETLQTWGLAAAQAWHDGQPITSLELETLLNACAVLPINETWKRTCSLVLEHWSQRQKSLSKVTYDSIELRFLPFILRFACRSGNSTTLNALLNKYAESDLLRTNGILLEGGDWPSASGVNLRKNALALSRTGNSNGWLPPAQAALDAIRTTASEDALLAESVALTASDADTSALFPNARWSPHDERFEAFAKKLAAAPLPSELPQRAQTLVTVGLEHPVAALSLLPQFDAISRHYSSNALGGDDFRYELWADFLAVHAALKLAKQDFSLADSNFKRVQTDAKVGVHYGSAPLETRHRTTLFRCLTRLWSSGLVRDPEKLLSLPAFGATGSVAPRYGCLSATTIRASLEAWNAVIKQESLPSFVGIDLKKRGDGVGSSNANDLVEFLVAIASSGKNRLSFPQRWQLFIRLAERVNWTSSFYYDSKLWPMLVHRGIFTAEELLQNAEAAAQASSSLTAAELESYGLFARREGDLKAASLLLAEAARRWPAESKSRTTSDTDRSQVERAAMLIRLKDFEEARRCLEAVNPANPVPATITQRDALLQMLPKKR